MHLVVQVADGPTFRLCVADSTRDIRWLATVAAQRASLTKPHGRVRGSDALTFPAVASIPLRVDTEDTLLSPGSDGLMPSMKIGDVLVDGQTVVVSMRAAGGLGSINQVAGSVFLSAGFESKDLARINRHRRGMDKAAEELARAEADAASPSGAAPHHRKDAGGEASSMRRFRQMMGRADVSSNEERFEADWQRLLATSLFERFLGYEGDPTAERVVEMRDALLRHYAVLRDLFRVYSNLIGSLRPTTTAYQMDLEEFASFILDTNVRLGLVSPKESFVQAVVELNPPKRRTVAPEDGSLGRVGFLAAVVTIAFQIEVARLKEAGGGMRAARDLQLAQVVSIDRIDTLVASMCGNILATKLPFVAVREQLQDPGVIEAYWCHQRFLRRLFCFFADTETELEEGEEHEDRRRMLEDWASIHGEEAVRARGIVLEAARSPGGASDGATAHRRPRGLSISIAHRSCMSIHGFLRMLYNVGLLDELPEELREPSVETPAIPTLGVGLATADVSSPTASGGGGSSPTPAGRPRTSSRSGRSRSIVGSSVAISQGSGSEILSSKEAELAFFLSQAEDEEADASGDDGTGTLDYKEWLEAMAHVALAKWEDASIPLQDKLIRAFHQASRATGLAMETLASSGSVPPSRAVTR